MPKILKWIKKDFNVVVGPHGDALNFSPATVYFFIFLGTIILITSCYLSNYIDISLTNCQIHKRSDIMLKNLVEVKHKVA